MAEVAPLHDYPPEYITDRAVLDVGDAIAELEHQFIHNPAVIAVQWLYLVRQLQHHAEVMQRVSKYILGESDDSH